jgi:hypothetical protein
MGVNPWAKVHVEANLTADPCIAEIANLDEQRASRFPCMHQISRKIRLKSACEVRKSEGQRSAIALRATTISQTTTNTVRQKVTAPETPLRFDALPGTTSRWLE